MQSLGKVPSARRAPQPVNLPSLRAESGSSSTPSADSTLAASSSSPPPPSQAPTVTNSTAPALNSGWTGSAAELAAHQKHPTPSQSPAPIPLAAQANPAAAAAQPATILDRKFQQEFPSLVAQPSSVGSAANKQRQQQPQPPAPVAPVEPTPRQESPQPVLQYGPGPSLRPQNEGSWAPGGRPSPSQGGPGRILISKLFHFEKKLYPTVFFL